MFIFKIISIYYPLYSLTIDEDAVAYEIITSWFFRQIIENRAQGTTDYFQHDNYLFYYGVPNFFTVKHIELSMF